MRLESSIRLLIEAAKITVAAVSLARKYLELANSLVTPLMSIRGEDTRVRMGLTS